MDTHQEQQYIALLQRILDEGVRKSDRTGTGTLSVFAPQMRFDLSKEFPLLTTKKVFFKGVLRELLWMISGSTNVKDLTRHGVHIWDEWADKDGDLGPVYGRQWRAWPDQDGTAIDQLKSVIEQIRNAPDSRRHVVSAWNVGALGEMNLHPCHALFQFYVAQGRLSCQLYQRSTDCFLGLPFNIASYALLTIMVARLTGYGPGEFVHTSGDAHLYLNHLEQARMQVSRLPRPWPRMVINGYQATIDDFRFEDFCLEEYDPHPSIKAPVAV